jgi:hypothetical protein
MSKEEFVSRFIADRAKKNRTDDVEVNRYHSAACGKARKIRRKSKYGK